MTSDIKLSHLQFVDDNMLIGKSSIQEAKAFNDILTTFGEASGMEINKIKSNIFFFNTPVYTQIRITRILGFQIRSSLPSKLLGAPLIDSALKNSSWTDLLNKLESKLSSRSFRSLNPQGRLTLLKSVLLAMPLYLLFVMEAPKHVLKAVINIQRNLLWGGATQARKWPLVSWKKLCKEKRRGGLGLRDPLTLNNILNAK